MNKTGYIDLLHSKPEHYTLEYAFSYIFKSLKNIGIYSQFLFFHRFRSSSIRLIKDADQGV